MPVIDLTRYIVAATGTWTDPGQDKNLFEFSRADTMSADRLLLRWAGDFVALTGPLRVSVTVQAENMTVPLAYVGNLVPDAAATFRPGSGGPATFAAGAALKESTFENLAQGRALGLQASTIYSYTLDIAAGQAWPFSLSDQMESLGFKIARAARVDQLGNNLGYRVIIEPAFAAGRMTPVSASSDLPCDFAVANHPNTASFFPSACEPCDGTIVGLPPSSGPALVTPPADGGCVRTHFFNGMFITREDLETEQRYHRLKSKLHNRAAGAGVVWGFDLGKQGSHLCVTPGYGVDCCGNDLVLTTIYKVEIAALMADPAARRPHRRGAARMHVLLEYVECPSDARPVHDDPCAPGGNRCEMSRIRESVRLRLVPPRDYQPSAPIARFLDEVRELRRRYPVTAAPSVQGEDRAPYVLNIGVGGTRGAQQDVSVRPSSRLDPDVLERLKNSARTIRVAIVPDPLWTFVGGTVSAQALGADGKVIPGAVEPAEPVQLGRQGLTRPSLETTFTLGTAAGRVASLEYKIANWHAQNFLAGDDDPAPAGDLVLRFGVSDNRIQAVEFVEAPIVNQRVTLAEAPCSGEPCRPRRQAEPWEVFECEDPAASDAATPGASYLPWLHGDPVHPGKAGDPKVLALAALGGWLTQMLVRGEAGTTTEVATPRREIAQGIYRMAWLLLFGVSKNANPSELGGALKRLLEAWCDALLWKGPQCCGDPHGVVIGCAVVDGGTIQSVDPFGGRRYVVHYPLLEHWGAQFGVAPFDMTVTRFFSKLCCVAALPAIGAQAGPRNPRPGADATPRPAAGGRTPNNAAVITRVGAGYLAIGDPADASAQLGNIKIVSRRQAGTPEMIAAALMLIGSTANEDEKARQYSALMLDGAVADQTVVLLVPA